MAKEMSENKKFVKAITSRDENFAQWYTDIVKEAKLCDYSSVKGCLNYLPNGYAIWENIQADLDKRFKDTGVENVYLPVFIPESLLEKEGDHIEGFAPEVAWVSHGGIERLEEIIEVPVLGIVPYAENLQLPEEDSASLKEHNWKKEFDENVPASAET